MVPFTHAAFFVTKNHTIKRGLEQKNRVIKKSWQIHLMCVMALRDTTYSVLPQGGTVATTCLASGKLTE